MTRTRSSGRIIGTMRNVPSLLPHYIDMENRNSTFSEAANDVNDVNDVFRPPEFCQFEQCPLDLSKNSLNSLVLYSVLNRYRNTFKIDGIRWIVDKCSRFIGGDCSPARSHRADLFNEAVLKDFWRMLRNLGFSIVTVGRRLDV